VRDLNQAHKEDWDTCTAAALAGGVTTILAMPNTQPPLTDEAALTAYEQAAAARARCDYGIHFGAGEANAAVAAALAPRCAGLKLYLDATFGPLQLDGLDALAAHFAAWPRERPILAHAESRTLAATLFFAQQHDRAVHICHVSRQDEIELIARAKARGVKVTCEVCPHHLLLTSDGLPARQARAFAPNVPALTGGYAEVRPRLATQADVDALWANLAVVDCFATDHAPHTRAEKDSPNPPPGFPGVELALSLWLTAAHAGLLTLDDILTRMSINPHRIFGLSPQPDTRVEIDPDFAWAVRAEAQHSRCAWTPYASWHLRGKVTAVYLRGALAYDGERVSASVGTGKNVVSR
jgi:carbamoyl-phosphate synthase/aspartate carbamoyltransferase/dihydroorotase